MTPVWKEMRVERSHETGRVGLAGCKSSCRTGRGSYVWLDDEGFTIDRRSVLRLPRSFEIEATEGADGGATLCWSGLPDWSVRVEGQGAHPGAGGEASVDIGTGTHVPLVLIDPMGKRTNCTVDLTVRRTHLSDRDGIRAQPGERIALAEMSDWMLRLPRRCIVDLTLTGRGGKPLLIAVECEGDVPLQELHGSVEWLLALSGNQDARVEMQVDGRRLCSVARPHRKLSITEDAVIAPEDFDVERPGLQAVVRPIGDHAREYALDADASGTWAKPCADRGNGIVYLRTGSSVLTRPVLIPGNPSVAPDDPFAAALLVGDHRERQKRIADVLDNAPETPRTLDQLRGIVTSLRGMSPLSLDVLALAGERPNVLAALLISATDAQRADILALERGLPFLWMGLPKSAWSRTINAQMDAMTAALQIADLGKDAVAVAGQAIVVKLKRIAEENPWFAAVQGTFGAVPYPQTQLSEIVQTHVRIFGSRSNRPQSLADVLDRSGVRLPDAIRAVNWQEHTALLAPFVLALRVQHDFALSPDERWSLRHALIFDRDYVTDAFPHCLEACEP